LAHALKPPSLPRVGGKFRRAEHVALHLDAWRAPVGAVEEKQDVSFLRFGLRLGLREVGQPGQFSGAGRQSRQT